MAGRKYNIDDWQKIFNDSLTNLRNNLPHLVYMFFNKINEVSNSTGLLFVEETINAGAARFKKDCDVNKILVEMFKGGAIKALEACKGSTENFAEETQSIFRNNIEQVQHQFADLVRSFSAHVRAQFDPKNTEMGSEFIDQCVQSFCEQRPCNYIVAAMLKAGAEAAIHDKIRVRA